MSHIIHRSFNFKQALNLNDTNAVITMFNFRNRFLSSLVTEKEDDNTVRKLSLLPKKVKDDEPPPPTKPERYSGNKIQNLWSLERCLSGLMKEAKLPSENHIKEEVDEEKSVAEEETTNDDEESNTREPCHESCSWSSPLSNDDSNIEDISKNTSALSMMNANNLFGNCLTALSDEMVNSEMPICRAVSIIKPKDVRNSDPKVLAITEDPEEFRKLKEKMRNSKMLTTNGIKHVLPTYIKEAKPRKAKRASFAKRTSFTKKSAREDWKSVRNVMANMATSFRREVSPLPEEHQSMWEKKTLQPVYTNVLRRGTVVPRKLSEVMVRRMSSKIRKQLQAVDSLDALSEC